MVKIKSGGVKIRTSAGNKPAPQLGLLQKRNLAYLARLKASPRVERVGLNASS
jgi:hypothetical protein